MSQVITHFIIYPKMPMGKFAAPGWFRPRSKISMNWTSSGILILTESCFTRITPEKLLNRCEIDGTQ